MTLSRIGAGATLSFVILAVWLGACGTTDSESCGADGLMNGTCQTAGDGGSCPTGSVEINTSESLATGCPPTYVCCGAPAAGGSSGTGSATTGSGTGTHS